MGHRHQRFHRSALATVLTAFAFATSAFAQAPPASTGRVRTARVTLKDGLFIERNITLRGAHAEARVTFTRPASWRMLPGSALHLIFTHSGILLGDHSALTVKVTDTARTVRLDPKDPTVNELVIPLDPSRMSPYNPIQLTADQHYTLECEDPFSEGLWTQISNESYIDFVYVEEPVFTDLAVFPYPFFDPLAYPPIALNYVLPRSPSAATATAIATVTAALAQDFAYRPLAIQFVDSIPANPNGHYIVIGTANENPAVAQVLNGPASVSNGNGMLASLPLPTDPHFAALVVTGGSPDGVRKAAEALADRGTRATMVGKTAVISEYTASGQSVARDWPGFVPDRTNFTLQDLGFAGETVRGVFSPPISIDVKIQPDARPVEFRQKLNIHYAYSADTHTRLSTLEVILNGISIHSAQLADPAGSESEWLTLEVPWESYGPFNRLELVFHLFPKSMKACERISDRQLWGTIFPDSNFVMPKDYWMAAPDVGAFARWGFPFTIRSDLSEVAFVLPRPDDVASLQALVRTAAFLAKAHVRPAIHTDVFYADNVPTEVLSSRHLIVFSPDHSGALTAQLSGRAFSLSPEGSARLSDRDRRLLLAALSAPGAVIEEVISPWNDQRVALLIQPTNEPFLGALISKDAPEVLARVSGNLTVLSASDAVNSVEVGPKRVIGKIPMWRRLRYSFQKQWQLFLIVGIIPILLLYWAARRLLARRRQRWAEEEQ